MRIREGFEVRRVKDTSIILRRSGDGRAAEGVFVLNETGEFLWGCLERTAREDELFSLLAREYEVPEAMEASVRQDIAAFLEELRSLGALDEE